MLGPIKCYSCGKVLGAMYRYFQDETRRMKGQRSDRAMEIEYLTSDNTDKSVQGQILDSLNLRKPCCRRHLLTHVDIL